MTSTSLAASPIRVDCSPYSGEECQRIAAQFARDGFFHLPGVLDADEVAALRDGIDRVFDDDRFNDNRYAPFVAVRMFEVATAFEDLLTREPIIGLVESILGANCHLIAQNAVRNRPGEAIGHWHVDEEVIFPAPPGCERLPEIVPLPIHLLTVQILLSDVPSEAYGPTQFVPGSHGSGRHPESTSSLTFCGRGPVSILGRAGDIYLHNGQCWHRGAPNTSDTTRYLSQMAFGKRWISQRFYPFVNYRMPQRIIDRADQRRLRVLGFHAKGPYG